MLDGIASGAVALLAGGGPGTALRLGVAMLALQASIGALNDLVDAPTDAGRKPGKPIPAGLVAPALARAVAIGAAGIGIVLAAPSGPGLVVLAAVVLAIGYGYDLRAKGTAWSWLPLAIGLPVLPVFGWYGAVDRLPAPFAVLLPTAVMAGAALAIANALADVQRDRAAAVGSVAIRLGPRRAWAIGAGLQVMVGLVAAGSAWAAGAGAPGIVAIILSGVLVLAGVALGRSRSPARLERAWEVQAAATAVLAVCWLWAMAGTG